jgi:hypothetical protein
MNDILRRLGAELQRKFASSLKRPLNWPMIDALVKIEEEDEAKNRDKRKKTAKTEKTDKPEA